MGVKWTGIGTVTGRLSRTRGNVQRGTVSLAATHAGRGQEIMKAEAPWNDQTGEARGGLYGIGEATGQGAAIELGGTAPHQPFLELGTYKMSPRPIIRPTMDRVEREFAEDVAELHRRWGG